MSEDINTQVNRNENIDKENKNDSSIIPNITIFSLASGKIFQTNACNRLTDIIFVFFSLGGFGFGIIAWFLIDNITSVGYILSGLFSSISLYSLRRMRLRAALQKSVNVLKEENDELKENNEELKENIDELEDNIDSLETIQKNLSDDLSLLKETIGIFGENSDEIIDNLKIIYINLKKENEVYSKINKNTIYLHILHIIKHYDKRSQFLLTTSDLEKAKNTLINAFPNLDYDELKTKITNNKITATNIIESIKL
tara:strand:- start:2619 stop:3383 length:765 start_codon:yes stop_codon:yes gene_type:complete